MKYLAILLLTGLCACSAATYRFKPGDIVYVKNALHDTTKFKIERLLPGGRYGMWDINSGHYVEAKAGSNLKPIKQ